MSYQYAQYELTNQSAGSIPGSSTHSEPPNGHHQSRPAPSQGEMVNGTISAGHPVVGRYLKLTADLLEEWKEYHRETGGRLEWPWHTTDGRCVSWWVAEKAAIVKRGDSWDVCHDHVESVLNIGELRLPTIKALFALAALKISRSPGDIAFWAFWGLKSAEKTAELVDEVVNTQPPLITLPESVVWADKASALAAIEDIRRPHLPTAVYPIQFISSNLHLFTEDQKSTQCGKRKRGTADAEIAAQPSAKQTRTRTARCVTAKPQVPVGPPRKSTRIRNNAEAAVAAATGPQPGPSEKQPVRTEPAGAAVAVEGNEEMEVDVETVDVVETGAPTEAQTKATKAPKKRRPTKKLTYRKSTTTGKSRAKKTAPAAAPEVVVEDAPQVPEVAPKVVPPSPGRIRIPARPLSTEPTSAPAPSTLAPSTGPSGASSPGATVVGTPALLEGATCANTPSGKLTELPKIELAQVDAKLVTAIQVPARVSARIREKKAAATVQA